MSQLGSQSNLFVEMDEVSQPVSQGQLEGSVETMQDLRERRNKNRMQPNTIQNASALNSQEF